MYLVYHGTMHSMQPEKQKIENRQMSSDFNEISGIWVIFGEESEFLVIFLFCVVKMV